MKSTSSPTDTVADSSNGSPKVPPLRIVFSTSASGSIGTNAANVDHTYSSSGDSSATSTAAEEGSTTKSRKRQKIGNNDVTTSSSASARGMNSTSQASVSSSGSSKKKHCSSSSDSEEEANPDQGSDRNEVASSGNGVTSPKSSSSTNAASSSNAASSKPTSPATTNQSEPKVPSLRINLPYVVTSSTQSNENNEDIGSTDYESNNNSMTGVSTSAGVSTSGRVTRSSQRAAQQQQQKHDGDGERHTVSPTSTSNSSTRQEIASKECGEQSQNKEKEIKDQVVRRRKLRNKQQQNQQQGNKQHSADQEEDNESTSSSTSSGVGSAANCGNSNSTVSSEKEGKSAKEFQMPSYNCYHMYLNIRKQIDKRRKQMFPVHPKAPQGFKEYLLNKGSYLLEGKVCVSESGGNGRNVPVMTPPPAVLKPGTGLYNLHIEQEKARHKLRLRHLIEREKLQLSTEQEVLRVHGRAALAVANQSLPFSVCTILKDEEIYNTIESETDANSNDAIGNGNGSNLGGASSASRNEYQRTTYTSSSNNANTATDLVALTGNPGGPGARSRYNGRLFISWMQDIVDKWEKIKVDTIARHKRESESLHAIQKLEWEWKMKELGVCDVKCSPHIDDVLVPSVQ
ncbi:ankyrin repeat domain-containing protein 12-like isoform X12, partial [Dinothrombium tinctorium]